MTSDTHNNRRSNHRNSNDALEFTLEFLVCVAIVVDIMLIWSSITTGESTLAGSAASVFALSTTGLVDLIREAGTYSFMGSRSDLNMRRIASICLVVNVLLSVGPLAINASQGVPGGFAFGCSVYLTCVLLVPWLAYRMKSAIDKLLMIM